MRNGNSVFGVLRSVCFPPLRAAQRSAEQPLEGKTELRGVSHLYELLSRVLSSR